MENEKDFQSTRSARQAEQSNFDAQAIGAITATIARENVGYGDDASHPPTVDENRKECEDIGYDGDEAFSYNPEENNSDLQCGNDKNSDGNKKLKKLGRMTTKAIAYTAVMTALVYVGSLIGYSSAQFYFNLGDAVILIAAALLNPVSAMIAGGLGSFLCDLTVYPATMVFTLFIKAIEGLIAGLLFKLINRIYDKHTAKLDENADDYKAQFKRAYSLKIVFSCLAALVSVTVMMMGYFMCQSLFYGTVTGALVALPFDAAQGAISTVVAMLALYALKFDNFRFKLNLK